MKTNSVVNSNPLPHTVISNVRVVKLPIVKELLAQNSGELPQNICVQHKGQIVWGSYSNKCKLTNQAIYRANEFFIVLVLPTEKVNEDVSEII